VRTVNYWRNDRFLGGDYVALQLQSVQLALQQQGYYAGPIDGLLGPQTRGALAAFQSDYGLAITSPTLQTLGLT